MPEPRLRRSLLITPGNRPDRMAKAVSHRADAFVFDLEDAVPPPEKPGARRSVAKAVRQVRTGGRELCVRINGLGSDDILADLADIPLDVVDTLMIPKVERAEDLLRLDERLDALEREAGRTTPLDLIVSIETPRGLLSALQIADASRRASALFFGSGDYSAATGCAVTATGLQAPRALVSAAAAAAGLQAIDAAFFLAVKDAEATRQDALAAREHGFAGKLVFHPVQIDVANEVFRPTMEDVGWAERVIAGYRDAAARGLGTAMVDGAFVAVDILLMAERILWRAGAAAARDERHAAAELLRTLRAGGFIGAPGVFDMISALMADRSPAEAIYVTGYGAVASHLGLPDAGLATYTDMIERVGRIAAGVSKPVIADADTGYGGLLNVRHTVRGYEAAGVTAIQIEDQDFPKKCGHTPNRRVIPADEMVRKIRVASDARSSSDFLIVARTDARTALGLDEALRRGEAYARAGADVLFIESPETEDELALVGSRFDVPVLANMVHGGRTPVLTRKRLAQLGFQVAIYPAVGFLAVAETLRRAYASVAEGEAEPPVPLFAFSAFNELIGFPDIWAFEALYADEEIAS